METLIRGFGRWAVSRNEVCEVLGNVLSSQPNVQIDLSRTCSKIMATEDEDKQSFPH